MNNDELVYPVNIVGNSMVKVTINDEQYMSLIDSGSDICVIPSSIVRGLGCDSMINVPFRDTIEVTTAYGEKQNVTALYNITFQVGVANFS